MDLDLGKSYKIRNRIEFEWIQLHLYNKGYSWDIDNLRLFGIINDIDLSFLIKKVTNKIDSYPITIYLYYSSPTFFYLHNVSFEDTISVHSLIVKIRKDKLEILGLIK